MHRLLLAIALLAVPAGGGGLGDMPKPESDFPDRPTTSDFPVIVGWAAMYQTPTVAYDESWHGSACPVGAYALFTAWHVVEDAGDNPITVHWPQTDGTMKEYRVVVWRTWKKRDVAILHVLPSAVEGEPTVVPLPRWFTRASKLPIIGAPVMGVRRLGPPLDQKPGIPLVPSHGRYLGTVEDGALVISDTPNGGGTSGSCLLDADGRIIAMMQAITYWARPVPGGVIYDSAGLYVPMTKGLWEKGWDVAEEKK